MAATAWSIGALEVDASKQILAADEHRDHVTVQLHAQTNSGQDIVYLGFGEDAVSGEGLFLGQKGCSVRVLGPKARLAINAICDAVVSGGTETMEDIEYRHVRDHPSWQNDKPQS